MKHAVGPLLILVLAGTRSAFSQTPRQPERSVEHAGPGYVLDVDRSGHDIRSVAVGQAHVELQAPLTPRSVFRVGSLTKPVVAASIMRLQELGRLSIDDRLDRFLPSFPGAATITLRQLLAHTSGVSDAWDTDPTKAVTTDELVALISSQPSDFPPGSAWRYSNSGYMLLGAVIEVVEKRPWCDAVQELVLAPARMTQSGCHPDRAVVPRAASGYVVQDDGSLLTAPYYSMTGPGAAGALYSTAGDLQRFIHAIAAGTMLDHASVKAMTTEQHTSDGAGTGYGLGLYLTTVHGMRAWEHDGRIDGFMAQLTYLPLEDVSAVVLANVEEGPVKPRSMAHREAAAAARRPYPVFKPIGCPHACSGLAGRYGEPGRYRQIFVQGGRIYSQRPGGPRRQLDYVQGDRLVFAGDGTDYFNVVRNKSGAPIALEFHADASTEGQREPRL